jgi:multidrug resistance efflux pump
MNKTSELGRPTTDGNGAPTLGDRVRSLRLHDTGPAPGEARGRPLPWVLCLVLLVTTVAFGYRAYRMPAADGTPAAGDVSKPAGTQSAGTTAAPTASGGDVVLPAKGYVIPAHKVQVSPKVGGMIVWLDPNFKEGKFYKEGEVMARLETVDYLAGVKHAEAALRSAQQKYEELHRSWPKEIEQAQREVEESKATQQQLYREMVRNERLIDSNAAAQRDWEQAKFGYDAMARRVERLQAALWLMKEGPRKEKLKAAEADVKAAEADLGKANWLLDNCEIRAPISGHVLTKTAEKGNVVNPLAFSIAAALCDMADLADLEIDLSIQEHDIKAVFDNQYCTVIPVAYEDAEVFRAKHPDGYKGRVSRQMPIADRNKGAIQVRVKVEIPREEVGKFLKPDMSVMVYFYRQGYEEKSASGEQDKGR